MSIETRAGGARAAASKPSLVLFPGALGDFVCFLPALRRLASNGRVDLFARSEYRELAPPPVTTRSLERAEIARLFTAGADATVRRFCDSYAIVYSWMASGEPTFVANLSRLTRGQARIFPFRPPDWRRHIADYYLSCLGQPASGETSAPIVPSGEAVNWSLRFWQARDLGLARVLAIAPGSGAKEKNWPMAFFREVTRWWERSVGGRVLAFLGPAEAESSEPVNLGPATVEVRNENLGKVAGLLIRCDVYLGNDSGMSHLAAALGMRTVALFGPTDPIQWSPRGKSVVVVRQDVACSPCSDSMRRICPHRICLNGLAPDRVIEALTGLFRDVSPGGSGILDKGECRV